MDQRAKIPVTLPRPTPTRSYWQTPPDPISDHRTTATLPETADIVIIGSGITGAAVAWHLLQDARAPPTVLMLEARQACSGATGRNGGHTKAASYRSFRDHAATLGPDAAVQIARLELANILAVHAFARDHGIACDLEACDTIDVVYSAAEWDAAQAGVAAMRAAMPVDDPAAEYRLCTADEVRREFHSHDYTLAGREEKVQGGVVYFAGSLSAYRFGVGVLRMCLERGLNLQTNTPAVGLRELGDGGWEVTTDRGSVRAKRIVLATNGYTAHLVPQFQGVIVPFRGQMTAQRPGQAMPHGGSLPTTYSFIYDKGYEYMVPRPADSVFAGDIMIGGGLIRAPEDGLYEFGTTDDTTVNETISAYLGEAAARYFGPSWGPDATDGRVRTEWTGIMGHSPDGLPFVGEVPGSKGLWVCASFQGHGMVLCWKSAQALVEIMENRDGPSLQAWFPDGFRVNEERMAQEFSGRL